jgi:UDP-glucose 4-epimerase
MPDVYPVVRVRNLTIRYFNVFGPRRIRGRRAQSDLVVRDVAFCDRQPLIYGDGEQTRDFTYVSNVGDGVLRACESPKAVGEVINVATGGRISLNELLETMNRIVGTRPGPFTRSLERETSRLAGRPHEGESTSRLRSLVALEEGLRQTIDWCRREAS